jgi:hypothetical protein
MNRIQSLITLTVLLSALPAMAADPKPAKPQPPASSGATFDTKDLSISGSLGGEFGDLDLFSLRADASLPIVAVTPEIRLHGVLSLGLGFGGQDVPYGSASWTIVTLVPAARFQLRAAPKVEVYGDAGLGLYMGFSSADITIPGIPPLIPDQHLSSSDTSVGVMMRFAVGALYELNPKVKLSGELGLTPYFGDASTTNFVLLVGAQFKL